MRLVANARMYAVNPAVEEAWRRLFLRIGEMAGVDLAYLDHPAPASLPDLWDRSDLGLAFMCGWPFANSYPAVQALAGPRPGPAWAAGSPTYRTDLVVSADRELRVLSDTFGGRIGWTAEHSQSGYLAVVDHLSGLDVRGGASRFGAWVGPLVTPRGVVDAILAGDIDVGPLDSYWRELLSVHEPDTARRLRVVASTRQRPMPLLVASSGVERSIAEQLRQALIGAASDPVAGPILGTLCLAGFAPVARPDYAVLLGPAPSKPGELSSVR